MVHLLRDWLRRLNVILVLRRLAIASRNLPIQFTRFHPADSWVWQP